MRELKFRVWTGNSMWSPKYRTNWEMLRDARDEPHATVMQFTGLTDRNGVEIYEGDILRLKNSKGQTANCQEVYWDEESAAFDWRTVSDNSWPDGFTGFYDEYEVIGNIYDNPELLEPQS